MSSRAVDKPKYTTLTDFSEGETTWRKRSFTNVHQVSALSLVRALDAQLPGGGENALFGETVVMSTGHSNARLLQWIFNVALIMWT